MVPVSAEKMAEIDERAQKEYGIRQEDLMERAGIAVANAILTDIPCREQKEILVICGKGNNGGDGLVAARRLFAEAGGKVRLYAPEAREIKEGAAFENLKKAVSMGMTSRELSSVLADIPGFWGQAVVVDALLGTGYRGAMTGIYGDIARKVNSLGLKVYSVDVPSGLDATTGEILGDCFKAFRTITFGLPKTGFYRRKGPDVCGDIEIADIGFPKGLLEEFL